MQVPVEGTSHELPRKNEFELWRGSFATLLFRSSSERMKEKLF